MKIKWGIIGLGQISSLFVEDLMLIEEAKVVAVASRTQIKANTFAKKYNVAKAYGSYDDILNDPEIDIIYIGTPHDSHAELSIKAMKLGKNVLCEKPVALNKTQAQQMIAASQKYHQFFMEAFWARFNPSISEVFRLVREGAIGEVKYINADFAFKFDIEPGSRMTDMNLGGGSLLDMGVYPIFLTYLLLGIPERILASSRFYHTGADEQTSMIFQYKNAQAILHSSFESPSKMEATISGTNGRINLNPIWHETESYTLVKDNHQTDSHFPKNGKGYTYEIEECHKCLKNKVIESDLWSHQDSLSLIGIVDEVRNQIGLKYPME